MSSIVKRTAMVLPLPNRPLRFREVQAQVPSSAVTVNKAGSMRMTDTD
jgi:hypothetical protein